MDKHQVVLITDRSVEDCQYLDGNVFEVLAVAEPRQLLEPDFDIESGVVVVDYTRLHDETDEEAMSALYVPIRDVAAELSWPVVIMVSEMTLNNKLRALNAGFSDVIPITEPRDEISTRLLRELYHEIADRQLKQQLNSASEAAMAAMRESSNLGGNVHFLVQAHQCRNLDELGQLFFLSMKNYGLNCSLQMRSSFGVKNMEVNGMAKQLESDLLTQLKDAGRYYDFGRRTVVNYGVVSVLIRNMPEDETLYGLVKDNTFTLLQGLDARVRALDGYMQLEEEKCALQRLSTRVNIAMEGVNNDYQAVMRDIVDVVENMAEKIGEKIPLLLLNEDQEQFIESAVVDCVMQANQVFAEGFKVDRHFGSLRSELESAIRQAKENEAALEFPVSGADAHNDAVQDVELF